MKDLNSILYKIIQRTIIIVGPVYETNSKDFKDLEPSRVIFSDHISVEMEINTSIAEEVFWVLFLFFIFKKREN